MLGLVVCGRGLDLGDSGLGTLGCGFLRADVFALGVLVALGLLGLGGLLPAPKPNTGPLIVPSFCGSPLSLPKVVHASIIPIPKQVCKVTLPPLSRAISTLIPNPCPDILASPALLPPIPPPKPKKLPLILPPRELIELSGFKLTSNPISAPSLFLAEPIPALRPAPLFAGSI